MRHIHQFYKDPVTGKNFEIVRAVGVAAGTPGGGGGTGGIIGVRSASQEEPFKKEGFPEYYADFKDVEHYSDWQFVYRPRTTQKMRPTDPLPGESNPGFPGQRALSRPVRPLRRTNPLAWGKNPYRTGDRFPIAHRGRAVHAGVGF